MSSDEGASGSNDYGIVLEKQLIENSCLAAAEDLGIRIVAPFEISDGDDDVSFIAFFPDFGSRKGALVCHIDEWLALYKIAHRLGYFCSGLHPDSYRIYDRERFIETLIDWHWLGEPTLEPRWFTA